MPINETKVTLAGISSGGTVMRFRNRMVEGKIFNGGITDPAAISPAFGEVLFKVGTRPGHYKVFLSLINNAAGWERVRAEYGNIEIPVLLVLRRPGLVYA